MSETLLEVRGLKKYFPIKRGVLSRTVGHVRAVDEVSFDVRAGEVLLIEPGQEHLAHNASRSEEVVALWQTRPAIKTPLLFATLAELDRRGRSLLDLPLMASTFREEFVLARPPRLVQDCVFGILAPLVRLLGHRLPTD